MARLIAGSYIFAEASAFLKRTVDQWGAKEKIILPELLHSNRLGFAVLFSTILVSVLLMTERVDVQ